MNSSKFECIDGFAEELDELVYEGFSNWFVSFRSLFTVYSAHFSYLLVFISIISCGLFSYKHSVENGSKFTQFWWGAFLHGIISERSITATKYWHAQAPVMFFGKQLPLHIIFLYPSIIYLSMMAVQRLKLKICVEPAAVGLIAMLMETPYRMISVKFLHITYHDSEPLYYHKLCGVPWIEIFSSLVFASSYVSVYYGAKFYHTRDLSMMWDRSEADKKETMITVLCGLLSPIAGFLQKIFLFHFFHDFFNVNPISCLFFAASLYLCFVVCFEPREIESHVNEDTASKTYLFYQISLFLCCLLYLALFGKPQNEISIGTHQPIGDCTTLIFSRTPLGRAVKRKKYLCADEVSSRKNFVFNFDCLEEGPSCLSAIWYTICGSPICNRPQFFLNILSFAILISSFFSKILFSDLKTVGAAKRLVMKFQRDEPSDEYPETSTRDEVSVGFVFLKNNIQFLPKSFRYVKNKVS